MTENAKPTETLSDRTWNVIISLLSDAYPDLTIDDLKQAIAERNHEKLDYVRAKEACRMFSCSWMTLRRWEKLGYIRARRPSSRLVLYSLEDIKKKLGS